jgi:pimeloyl-ACP methyl ester carboxylesterase
MTQRLDQFLVNFEERNVHWNSIRWPYFAGGSGEETCLFLHGSMGNGANFFEYAMDLGRTFRIIAPTLPVGADTVRGVVAGIAAILDIERAAPVHVFGHSLGGFLAAELARRMPALARTLMMSGTAIPNMDHAAKVEWQLAVVQRVPDWLVTALFPLALKRALRKSGDAVSEEQLSFLLGEMVQREMILTSAKLQLDFYAHPSLEPAWRGPTLIFETERDPMFTEQERAALRAAYPQAVVERIPNAGHLAQILQAEEYIRLIRRFLNAY